MEPTEKELTPTEVAEFYFSVANEHFQSSNFETAEEFFVKAHRLNPNLRNIDRFLGLTYLYLQRTAEAIEVLHRAVKNNPDSVEDAGNLANAYYFSGDNTSAKVWYERAMQINPDCPDIYYQYGVLHWQESAYGIAVENFQKTLSLNPAHALALYNLGVNYERNQRWTEAKDYYEAAIKIAPNSEKIMVRLAAVYPMLKMWDRRAETLSKLLAIGAHCAELRAANIIDSDSDESIVNVWEC